MTNQTIRAGSPVLHKGVVYLAPSGRCCMLAPDFPHEDTSKTSIATLVYHRADGTPGRNSMDDGFTLSEENFRTLRRLG